jgi:AcrR family transcriptional regulator
MTKPKRERRTQEERRAATIRKLLDATEASLAEVGYVATTIQAVCARAGISQGGLFRHFKSHDALMAAAGRDLGEKMLTKFAEDFSRERLGSASATALRLLDRHSTSRFNLAWLELAMAARTRPALRRALRPIGTRYFRDICKAAHALLPEVATALGPAFPMLIDAALSAFDGAVVHRSMVNKPFSHSARADQLATLGDWLEHQMGIASR